MARDRRIGGVGQAELLEAGARALGRRGVGGDAREEAVEHQLLDLGARRARRAARRRSACEPRPATVMVHERARPSSREQPLLGDAAGLHQRWKACGSSRAAAAEPRLDAARERQIHVVAAEQQVIADRGALEASAPVAVDGDQREVGGAAADVATPAPSSPARERAPPGRRRDRRARSRRRPAAPRAASARRAQPRAAARTRQLARHLVERGRHAQDDVLVGERAPGARGARRRPGGAGTAPTPRPARCAADLGAALSPHGRIGARRSTRGWHSHDLAERDQAARHLRALRARELADDRGRARRRPRQRAARRPAARARRRGRGTTAASGAAATSPGATSCGISSTTMRADAARGSTWASAELVVPRSMPTTYRGAASAHSAPRARCTRASSGGRRRARRTTARACRPRSRASCSVHRHQLAGVRPRRPRARSRPASAPSDPRRRASSTSVPTRSSRPRRRRQEAELGRLADDQAELAAPAPRPRCPPPCRTAPRTAPCSGGAMPGHRRHRRLDADVVGARGAAADAHALAAPDQAVVRGAVRDGEIEVGAARAPSDRPRASRPSESSVSTTRWRSSAPFMTPPLNRTAVAAPVRADEAPTRWRVIAGSAAKGRPSSRRPTRARRARLRRRARVCGKKPSTSTRLDVAARELGARACRRSTLRAAAEHRDRRGVADRRRRAAVSLAARQRVHQRARTARGRALCPSAFEPRAHGVRQRQVHVVAAEQDVIADGDALEREVAVGLADGDQREVGGAAADVADQHDVADGRAACASRRPRWPSQA